MLFVPLAIWELERAMALRFWLLRVKTPPELAQLRGLAATAGGLNVELVSVTGCPFNAAGAHCWGSSWVACHGVTQLAKGSCSAITHSYSTALLVAAQEAMLGLHSFLGTSGVPANRVRVSLSLRRSQEDRSTPIPTPSSQWMLSLLSTPRSLEALRP